MDAVIRKWGNSPALRLTTAILKEAGLQLGERVELVVSKGQVVITAIDKVEYDLETLIGGINAKNTHGETPVLAQ
jgi:antitoxin MazE